MVHLHSRGAGPPYCIWFEQFNGQVYVPQPKPYCGGLVP
jgi:hypothetical protein